MKKMKTKVTVVVPVYNSENTLVRCISSLCKQDYLNLEILLIDNNSTDNSRCICEQYSRNDSRIRVLQEKKKGPSAARNKGILEGTGDILCFVDSDDELVCDTAVTEIVSAMKDKEMVWFDYVNSEPQKKRGNEFFFRNNDSLTAITALELAEEYDFELTVPVVWNKAFCFDIVRKNNFFFPEDREYGEDFLFVLQYLTKISEVQFVHKVFYKKWEGRMTAIGTGTYDLLPTCKNTMGDIATLLQPESVYGKAYINMAKHLSSKAVIAVVRIHHPKAGLLSKQCKKEITELLHCEAFRQAFGCYRPQKGQSRTLPFCMRRGWAEAVYVLGKVRAKKAYIQK